MIDKDLIKYLSSIDLYQYRRLLSPYLISAARLKYELTGLELGNLLEENQKKFESNSLLTFPSMIKLIALLEGNLETSVLFSKERFKKTHAKMIRELKKRKLEHDPLYNNLVINEKTISDYLETIS